jgi:hypothetical protein
MAPPSLQVWLGQETSIDAVPTWVDITSYVVLPRVITVIQGTMQGGGAQPGTASLTLDNTDGRFTIGNTGSPLYPYVHLQSLVKIWRDGRPWFIGRIQAAPLSWPTGGDTKCIVTVSLADRLARFARMSLQSFAIEELLSTNRAAYWPMNDASTATSLAQAEAGSIWGPMIPGTTLDGTVVIGSGAVKLTPNTGTATVRSTTTANLSFSPSFWGLTAVVATTVGGTVALFLGYASRHGIIGSGFPPWAYLSLAVESYSGQVGIMVRSFMADSAASDNWAFFAMPTILDGLPHAIIARGDHLSLYSVWVDGVSLSPFAGSVLGANYLETLSPGFLTLGGGGTTRLGATSSFNGSISHFSLDFALTDTWTSVIAQINTALLGSPLSTQSAILKALGWRGQAAGALVDAGVTDSISSKELGNSSLAAVLGSINESEAGTLYVDGQDRLTWRNRSTLLSPTISLAGSDIDPATIFNTDIQGIATVVRWSQLQVSGSVAAGDVTTIGEISGSVTSISTVPGDGADHASWVANTSPRGPYIGGLSIDLMTATSATATAVATAGILTKVVLTGMPSQAPPASTTLEVVGVEETISLTDWTVKFTTKPAGPGSARDVLIWDDATYGFWDAGHRWAY